MSFEEYLDTNYNEKLDDLTKFLINDAYKAGAQSRQAEIDELQKKIDEALKTMDAESIESWGLWKEKADMYDQGASDAYEKSYWILKGQNND